MVPQKHSFREKYNIQLDQKIVARGRCGEDLATNQIISIAPAKSFHTAMPSSVVELGWKINAIT